MACIACCFIFGVVQIAISTLANDAYYIIKGGPGNNCLDLDCVTRTLNAHETAKVRCCADNYPDSTWTYVDSCEIWAVSWLFGQVNCYITTWEKASWLCDNAGGRLCTKSELENGCAANNGGRGCGFDQYMVWSSTSGELPKDADSNSPDSMAPAYYYAAKGRSHAECLEPSCSTAIVSQYDVKAVRCCSEKQEYYDWVSNCGIWANSEVPFCYIVDWETAKSTCSNTGGRLCTKMEVENDCTIGTGCWFDTMLVWTSDGVPTVDPTDSPTETPTDQPTQAPTDLPTQTPRVAMETPKARWVKVGCNTDGVYTEVIKDQIIRHKSPQISFSEFHNLLLTELLFEGEKVNGRIPLILAKTWEFTYSTHMSNTYRCDYFDNLVPFTGGCMWRLEVTVGFEHSKMIWMPHIVKCSKAQPKCAPLIACANEECSMCKKEVLSFQNTVTFF